MPSLWPSPHSAIVACTALLLAVSAAGATELRDAEIVAGGQPVLQNLSGSVRLEDARLGRITRTVLLPEPGGALQLQAGVALLSGLAARGRRRHR